MSGAIRTKKAHNHTMPLEDAKEEQRNQIRAARARLTSSQRHKRGIALAQQAMLRPEIASARCVATYVSVKAEPQTEHLISLLHEREVKILLPVLGEGLTRTWAQDSPSQERQVNAPGRPPEPTTPHLEAEALREAEVILAPALQVDHRGVRLGQGGGWFDRALLHAHPDALFIAMIYDEEFLEAPERLPRAEHDLPVHAVLTPTRWIVIDE